MRNAAMRGGLLATPACKAGIGLAASPTCSANSRWSHIEPDVVFWFPSVFPRVAYCVNAAVCSEECNPNSLHETKVQKYDQPEVTGWIKR